MLQLDKDATRDALDWPPLIEALRTMFRDGCEMPVRHHHDFEVPGEADGTLLLMPAWVPGRYLGVKLATVVPGNGGRDLPAVMASYCLSDARTGQMLALVDGGELTARRTAAASALAADYLARADARHLVIVGTGRLSANLAAAHAAVRPLSRISVWGRDLEKAKAAAAEISEALDIYCVAAPDLEAAVREADIVSAATLSETPLIHGDWLPDGCHVDLVGAFKPSMRESDDAAVARARVFVDTRAGAMKEGGDIVQALMSGTLHESDIQADLFDLCQNTAPGRQSDSEITLFKSVGAALEDLAGAILAYETASAKNAAEITPVMPVM
ncbi:ornithine cyclodeaminase family protein [Stappia taiwanensis]|uniref:Ornithine cyclodeaminase family protein n=1 Tax=Stappia taiwanensis TaxID=992267 RepID=A0A838XRM9_9HYPH|nr:ornithine cyclodeaminase family protein [Stappia taiwanensis]MBA4611711.1 ornithine cyclodeaminase family protein [Stappia taiwanensis]GGE97393.1 ornithine cyclodeaminase [Stappia taiwanensis]